MPNVSGFVYYDPTRTGIPGTGIATVPVALRNDITGLGAIALTDLTGAYTFTNVPAGSYKIVETWGTPGGIASPVDFLVNAAAMAIPPEIEPPLSAVSVAVPPLADVLDALTPNLLQVVVAGVNLTGQNFFDGPVGDKPLIYSGVTFIGSNLITAADNGTWGSYAGGTAVMTTVPVEPYPGVTPGFTYTASTAPADGQYTVMNTRTGFSPWWPISDHTSMVETGRYALINGAVPGSIVFTETVAVTPNTDYAFTSWILNLLVFPGVVDPQLTFKVIASDSTILLNMPANDIPDTPTPIWFQNGFVFNSGAYSSVTVQILNDGSLAAGNDYIIDDVELFAVNVADLLTVHKTALPAIITTGTDVTVTVTLTNTSATIAKKVFFQDVLDPSLTFVFGSILVDGSPIGFETDDPNAGFFLADIPPSGVTVVVFHAIAGPGPHTVLNTADVSYDFLNSQNDDAQRKTIVSNTAVLIRRSQACNDLIESVALEQTALAHILNAEGEKIQKVLNTPGVTSAQLLAVNASVEETVKAITTLEQILVQKISLATPCDI